jgi:hypothetical protein
VDNGLSQRSSVPREGQQTPRGTELYVDAAGPVLGHTDTVSPVPFAIIAFGALCSALGIAVLTPAASWASRRGCVIIGHMSEETPVRDDRDCAFDTKHDRYPVAVRLI